MQKKTISVNRALKEMKTVNSRLLKGISSGLFVTQGKNSVNKFKGMTKAELEISMKADYDSVLDLIAYQNALKSEVIKSNAKTLITVNGTVLTIAEAIFRKESIANDFSLLKTITNQYANASREVEMRENELEKKFEVYITQMFGEKDKTTVEEIEKHREQYYKTNGYTLIDPLKVKDIIKEMTEKYENFIDEIDSLITDSNSITQITIEW